MSNDWTAIVSELLVFGENRQLRYEQKYKSIQDTAVKRALSRWNNLAKWIETINAKESWKVLSSSRKGINAKPIEAIRMSEYDMDTKKLGLVFAMMSDSINTPVVENMLQWVFANKNSEDFLTECERMILDGGSEFKTEVISSSIVSIASSPIKTSARLSPKGRDDALTKLIPHNSAPSVLDDTITLNREDSVLESTFNASCATMNTSECLLPAGCDIDPTTTPMNPSACLLTTERDVGSTNTNEFIGTSSRRSKAHLSVKKSKRKRLVQTHMQLALPLKTTKSKKNQFGVVTTLYTIDDFLNSATSNAEYSNIMSLMRVLGEEIKGW